MWRSADENVVFWRPFNWNLLRLRRVIWLRYWCGVVGDIWILLKAWGSVCERRWREGRWRLWSGFLKERMGDWVLESRSCSTPAVSSAARGRNSNTWIHARCLKKSTFMQSINRWGERLWRGYGRFWHGWFCYVACVILRGRGSRALDMRNVGSEET